MMQQRGSSAPEAAWRDRSARLFAEFERPAKAMVRRAFRDAFDDSGLDDIYSGAWVGTLRSLAGRHRDLTDGEIRSYVFTAVANQASRELRRRRRKPTAPLELVATAPASGSTPDEAASSAESSRVLRDLLVSMPARRRAVMLLRYGWGLEPKQVCALVAGLSARAYRKEVTRGVDELAEKLRSFERGEWCADRAGVLKTYAAGLADPETERQARAHLAHCAGCSRFVGRLAGRLHDLGTMLTLPVAIEAIGPGLSAADRLAGLAERAGERLASLAGRSPAAADGVGPLAGGGAPRGAGAAAGAGVMAKVGIGAGGKLAACVSGAVAVSACVATVLVPAPPPGADDVARGLRVPRAPDPARVAEAAASPRPPADATSDPAPRRAADPPEKHRRPADEAAGGVTRTSPTAPSPPPAVPAPAPAPAVEREFGVASAAPAETVAPVEQPEGGGVSAAATVREEFGP